MSIVSDDSACSVQVGVKRKAPLLVDLKNKLTKFGLGILGQKQELDGKVKKAESILTIVENKPANDSWTHEEFDAIVGILPENDEHWDANDVKFVYENLNRRVCANDVLADESKKACITLIKQTYQNMFVVTPKLKDQVVTADSLVDMMDKLAKKKPSKWGQKEVDMLLARYGHVNYIDASNSTSEAVEKYRDFLKQLSEYYSLRPDMKALIDPEVIIFDLSGVNVAAYNAAITAYTAAPPVGDAANHPAHFGAFPEAWNPGAIQTVFPMPNKAAANHFVGFMCATVANLRAIVIPDVTGAALVY